ncbi:MAG: P-loop NTPase fold protein [Mycobacteriales bacterium]
MVIATGSADGLVSLRDGGDLARLGPAMPGHEGAVRWGCWGELDGRPVLATGGDDDRVRLWEVVEEQLISVPRYRSDVGGDRDRLGRADEAGALAELLIARSARPPLAVGVFGDWGEGKSFFLDQLRIQVTARTQQVAADDEVSHRAVRQVWFNAWHYAETDLWASLVAELFSQLAHPTEPGTTRASEQRRQSRLSAEIIAQRGLRERLAGAEARLADLRAQAAEPASGWERLPAALRDDVTALAGQGPERLYRSLASAGWSVSRGLRLTWAVIRATRATWWAATVLLVAAAVAVTAWTPVPRWIGGVVAAIGLLPLAAIAAGIRGARRRLRVVRDRVDEWAGEQRDRLQIPLQVATQEVTDLRRQLQDLTAAGQLAGLVAEQAGRGDYRSRLGLMTQIRADFERMAALLAAAGTEHDTDDVGDTLPAIDRIVIYVDDLDRCPPARVVDMLEAIHLLLAVELFVVVVAVDPRWLLQALHSHYREQLTGITGDDAGTADPWQPSAVQYLEKIFQVVLTLPPLTEAGYRGLVDHLTNPQDQTASDRRPPGTARATEVDPSPPRRPPAETEPGIGADPLAQPNPQAQSVDLPRPRVHERGDPLALTRDEQALMHLLGPPLISTPRAVKRLANSYGLLTALRQPYRDRDLDVAATGDHPGYRAAMALLAGLIGYPHLGPDLFTHLYHRAAAEPAGLWSGFRDGLRPCPPGDRRGDQTWTNTIAIRLDRAQAEQWKALTAALTDLEGRAEARGLPLPRRLDSWAAWIQPVGRLSFPTGRVVSNLDRHPPLL